MQDVQRHTPRLLFFHGVVYIRGRLRANELMCESTHGAKSWSVMTENETLLVADERSAHSQRRSVRVYTAFAFEHVHGYRERVHNDYRLTKYIEICEVT
jgi:hypothetical protein